MALQHRLNLCDLKATAAVHSHDSLRESIESETFALTVENSHTFIFHTFLLTHLEYQSFCGTVCAQGQMHTCCTLLCVT